MCGMICFSSEDLVGSVVKLSECRLFIKIAYSYVEGEDMLKLHLTLLRAGSEQFIFVGVYHVIMSKYCGLTLINRKKI